MKTEEKQETLWIKLFYRVEFSELENTENNIKAKRKDSTESKVILQFLDNYFTYPEIENIRKASSQGSRKERIRNQIE